MVFYSLFLVRQEQELRNGGTVDKKLSTLADLFRPPIELMHKGSFETVRNHLLDTLHHTFIQFVWTFSEISDDDFVDHRWETRCRRFLSWYVITYYGYRCFSCAFIRTRHWCLESDSTFLLLHLQAKDCGQLENKWLMINIQNVQDFACQCLNRDVWSNDAVKTIIREHFIFWQVCSVRSAPHTVCGLRVSYSADFVLMCFSVHRVWGGLMGWFNESVPLAKCKIDSSVCMWKTVLIM